jgi:two-component system, OmpR family, KDP operon response regulator KdpE
MAAVTSLLTSAPPPRLEDTRQDAAKIAKLLLVDQESPSRASLQTALAGLGFAITVTSSGEEALSLVRALGFDVVLLDLHTPSVGGVFFCRRLCALAPQLPILMLSAHDNQDDRIDALEAGADDFLLKPLHLRELAARIRARIRRASITEASASVMRIGDLQLDLERRLVTKSGRTIRFTPKEFDLLHYLMANAGLPIRHSRLLKAVWGPEYGHELEYLRTFIRQLRKKIEDDPANPRYLLTDAHIGYRFTEAFA